MFACGTPIATVEPVADAVGPILTCAAAGAAARGAASGFGREWNKGRLRESGRVREW